MIRFSPEKESPTPFVTIYESELEAISTISKACEGKEVGGGLFGLLTRALRIIIFLATGPGPRSVLQYAFFQQDYEFFREAQQVIETSCGAQWVGSWHKHPRGLPHPSGPDVDNVITITKENGIRCWCDIIVNPIDEYEGRYPYVRYRSLGTRVCESGRIDINAYDYPDPQNGVIVPARFRVIPGISPFRLQMLANGEFNRLSLGGTTAGSAMEGVSYDTFNVEELSSDQKALNLEKLAKQISKLPESVQQRLKIQLKDDLVIISFPVAANHKAFFFMAEKAPHPVKAVFVWDGENTSNNFSDRILAGHRKVFLYKAHEQLTTILDQESHEKDIPDPEEPPITNQGDDYHYPYGTPDTTGIHDTPDTPEDRIEGRSDGTAADDSDHGSSETGEEAEDVENS